MAENLLAGSLPIQPMPWLDSFTVGDHHIDDEHRDLISAFNDFCALSARGLSDVPWLRVAHDLIAMTEEHFANEEALFPTIGYDGKLSHVREHLSVVNALQSLFLGAPTMDAAMAAATGRIVMVDHIVRHDLAFKTWVLHAAGL